MSTPRIAPCMTKKCPKKATGETCRAEDKQSCEIYMAFWQEGVELSKKRGKDLQCTEVLVRGIDKALRAQKKGKRVGGK